MEALVGSLAWLGLAAANMPEDALNVETCTAPDVQLLMESHSTVLTVNQP